MPLNYSHQLYTKDAMQCIMVLLHLLKMHVRMLESDRNNEILKVAFFLECALKGTHLVLEPELLYLLLIC